MKTVTVYTDGACSGNPGPGGWGAILEYQGVQKELSGGEANTTNNRMELTADGLLGTCLFSSQEKAEQQLGQITLVVLLVPHGHHLLCLRFS